MLMGSCHCGRAHWTLEGDPGSITACNCTLCRRYGALWAYDYEGERISVQGPTASYRRPGKADPAGKVPSSIASISALSAWACGRAGALQSAIIFPHW